MRAQLHAPRVAARSAAGRLAIVTGLLVTLAVASMLVVGVRSLRSLAEARRSRASSSACRRRARACGRATRGRADARPGSSASARRCSGSCAASIARRAAAVPHALLRERGARRVRRRAGRRGAREHERRHRLGRALIVAAARAGRALPRDRRGARRRRWSARRPPSTEHDGVSVLAVRLMNDKLAARLGERAGLEVRIVDLRARSCPAQGPLAILNSDALVARRARGGVRRRARLVRRELAGRGADGRDGRAAPGGAAKRCRVSPRSARSTRRMLLVALVIAALATGSAVFIGRYWISAVEGLTEAARRLGSGDLATSIPVGGGKELTSLGNTLDEMRRNLVDLTGELRRRETEAQAVLGGIIEGVYAVDEQRRIRFLNPQAERLLKVSARRSDRRVLRRRAATAARRDGRRPCDYACPILQARRDGSGARGRAGRAGPGRERAPRRDRERGAGRRPPGSGAARRDGARGRAPHARHGAREHLARIPHAARRAARLDRALAATASARWTSGAQRELVSLAAARHAAADVAHRQPARERAHRVGPARHPPAGRAVRRRDRRGARPDRAAARAARPDESRVELAGRRARDPRRRSSG